jgi:3-deoxy-D-manno-octulosonic-acid transferase
VPRLNGLAALWAVAATVAAPGLRLALRLRQSRGKEAPGRLPERRGIDLTPRPPGRLIWLHAASVGETMSILPVLPVLAEGAPDATLLLTTGTVTSAELFARRLPELGLGRRVLHRFAPLDVPAWARRFLDHWRPDAAGFVESELWPNLLAACRVRGIPVVLINARLSDRSLARWRRAPGLARQVLGGFARIQARSETDAARLRELGCCAVTAPGDLKLAAPPLPVDEAELRRLRTMLAGRPVWLAASTHPGEETLIFAVHRALAADHPGLLTIIAPRHPERGAAIAAEAGGTPVARRALGEAPPQGGVWIVDTLGELGLWYRLTGLAFVGRSLIPPGGGQNPLEPARLGCAIAVGPYTGNFADHIAMLREAGGLTIVCDAAELTRCVDALLRDPGRRQAMADVAAASVQRHGDLPRRTAAALLELLPAGPA